MARGDMAVDVISAGSGSEILNRSTFEAVPMTIDFTGVTDTDAATGEKIVKAGYPIDANGQIVAATPWTDAVGILKETVREGSPQGTLLKKAYIHTTRAQAVSGLTYDAAILTQLNTKAGCRIVFEEPIITA